MARVEITERANADIDAFFDRLTAAGRVRAARNLLAGIEAACDRLAAFPAIGSARPRLGKSARRVLIPPFVLVYDWVPAADLVIVVRVLHERQRITRKVVRG